MYIQDSVEAYCMSSMQYVMDILPGQVEINDHLSLYHIIYGLIHVVVKPYSRAYSV